MARKPTVRLLVRWMRRRPPRQTITVAGTWDEWQQRVDAAVTARGVLVVTDVRGKEHTLDFSKRGIRSVHLPREPQCR